MGIFTKSHFWLAVIRSDGSVVFEPSDSPFTDLKRLQALVGGHIDVVSSCLRSLLLVVDDDGILRDKPFNEIASTLYDDILVGDVVVCSNSVFGFIDAEPDVYALSSDTAFALLQMLRQFTDDITIT